VGRLPAGTIEKPTALFTDRLVDVRGCCGQTRTIAPTTVRTYCRLCPAYCGLVVTHDGPQIVTVQGDRDHPVSQGYTCPKGRSLGILHHHPDRLDRPLMRRQGRLEPVSWDELLDDLSGRLGEILDAGCSADAIGAYFGTHATFDANLYWAGAAFLKALGSKSKYTSGTVDAPSYPVVRRLMGGVGWLFHSIDFERTTMTLLLGTNPVVSHTSHMNAYPNPTARLRELARRGELWVVDARLTETAELATRHLATRPGSDHALLGYLIRELLRDGADRRFLATHARNVDELGRAVERFDLTETTRLTGLPTADLTDLLASVRRHGRLAVQTGTGTSMAPTANLTMWFATALLAVTGSLEAPGGVWFNPGFVQGLDRRPVRLDGPAEAGPRSRPELPRWGGEFPSVGLIDEMETGNLQAIFVLGGNLLSALPDARRVRAALAATPVVVAVDVQRNEMVESATHVLPAAAPLERADLPHFSDCLAPTLVAQYTAAVVPPAADRRPGWWPLAALAERLGRPILPEGVALADADDDTLLRQRVRASARATFDELKDAGGPLLAEDRNLGWVARNVLPDGRWDLAPEALVAQLEEIGETAPLVLVPRRLWRRLNSYGRDLPHVAEREPAEILVHPDEAAHAGVVDGERACVASRHGSLEGVVRIDAAIVRGAMAIPHGWAEPNVSDLLSGSEDVDPLTGMPTYCCVPVSLRPVTAAPA
jgi:anaerobic selenocysteine-containing dehydrogenase